MRKIDSANNWPGLSELECEVKGTSAGWEKSIQDVVLSSLREQYSSLDLELPYGFERLGFQNVSTVTTGHQLQLFGGPAFLHYKTITAIRKARELNDSDKPVVPVFWIASEDHDFEEVRWIYGKTSKHIWEGDFSTQMVGSLELDGLLKVFESWQKDIETDVCEIEDVLKLSIDRNETYGQFFIRLLHLWYADLGLIVIDASQRRLKEKFAPIMRKELVGEGISSFVTHGSIKSRDINLFYIHENGDRIGVIKSDEGPISNKIKVVGDVPETLSPSVLLRPLYQETLLPNSHVILGPSELKYWRQLGHAFERNRINMPTLFLRDHVLIIEKSDYELFSDLGWSLEKGWWSEDDFIRKMIERWLVDGFGLNLNDLSKDDVLCQILKNLDIDFGGELLMNDSSERLKNKIRKTSLKKVKRHVKEQLKAEINLVTNAHKKVMNGITPQDRWGNFHVLSDSIGGYKNLRDKLLETTGFEGPVMQVIVVP